VTILKKRNKNESILNVTSFMMSITRCEIYLNFMFLLTVHLDIFV